jgi:hypothetical protein
MFNFIATDKLHVEFLESLLSHGTEQQVFDTVAGFIQTCSDRLAVLRDMESKVPQKVLPLTPVCFVISITFYFIFYILF